jgi:hypothetical protein
VATNYGIQPKVKALNMNNMASHLCDFLEISLETKGPFCSVFRRVSKITIHTNTSHLWVAFDSDSMVRFGV